MSKSSCDPASADGLEGCVPLARDPLDPEQAGGVVPMLKAVADPARLRLLSLASSTTKGIRRSTAWAAAASPIGPAPMMTTGCC